MSDFPRIAVGTIQADADGTAMTWALMDSLQRIGLRVQSFLSRAYFSPRDGATAITGLSPRHLDSWLMSEGVCRELFVRATRACDLALVEGRFDLEQAAEGGGQLETLCGWLDLPRLAVVDVSLLNGCHMPARPAVDCLLLDKVSQRSDFYRWQTLFESLWNIPVLGWLEAMPGVRAEMAAIRPGKQPPLETCHALGDRLKQNCQLDRIVWLARRRALTTDLPSIATWPCCRPRPLHVAVAYDDAFHGYFLDTLDLLELQGATVSDFSPLRDDRLPEGTDLVYLGCGHPELFAEELAGNDCMMLSIKSHLCGGRRIYAECGGMAYLCQQIEMPDGERWPMVGALPATACCHETAGLPRAAERTVADDTWLAPQGTCCRGYLNPRWSVVPGGPLKGCCAQAGQEFDLVSRHRAVGSRIHLDFAADRALLGCFFEPHATVVV